MTLKVKAGIGLEGLLAARQEPEPRPPLSSVRFLPLSLSAVGFGSASRLCTFWLGDTGQAGGLGKPRFPTCGTGDQPPPQWLKEAPQAMTLGSWGMSQKVKADLEGGVCPSWLAGSRLTVSSPQHSRPAQSPTTKAGTGRPTLFTSWQGCFPFGKTLSPRGA